MVAMDWLVWIVVWLLVIFGYWSWRKRWWLSLGLLLVVWLSLGSMCVFVSASEGNAGG
jgi:hypothetical protein